MSRVWVVLGLLALLCGRADAQPSPWEREERTTAGWTFTPGASFGAVPTTDRLQMDNVVPYADVDSRWVGAGAGFSFRSGPRTSIYGNYRFTLVTLDHPEGAAVLSELRDGHSHAPSLGFM